MGVSSTLCWFSLNEKSTALVKVKTEPVNFSRGSSIIPHSKVMLVLHGRAFSILTSEEQTQVHIKQPQQPSFSLQKSDIILLPSQLSSMFCLMRSGNISKYSTFDCCENVWEKIRSRLKHPVYAEDFQIWFTAEGLISYTWLQSLILFFRVICLLRCPGNFSLQRKWAVCTPQFFH